MTRKSIRAPILAVLAALLLCNPLTGAGTATAQDIWEIFRQQERARNDRIREERAKKERARQQGAKEDRATEEPTKEEPAKKQQAQDRGKEERTKEERAKAQRALEDRAMEARAREELAKEERAREERAKAELTREQRAKEERARADLAKEELAREERAREIRAKAERATAERAKADQANEERAKAERVREERAKAELAKEERAKEERAKEIRAKAERAIAERAKAERAREERAKAELAKEELAKEERAREIRAKAERAAAELAKAERAKEDRAKAELAKQELAKEQRAEEIRAKAERAREELAKADLAKEQLAKEKHAREIRAKAESASAERAKAERTKTGSTKAERPKGEERSKADIAKEQLAKEERASEERAREIRAKAESADAERAKAEREREERASRRARPTVPAAPGVLDGDRPLEPKSERRGSLEGQPEPVGRAPRGPDPPPDGIRSAAPIAVERQALAPLPAPPAWETHAKSSKHAPAGPPLEKEAAPPPRMPARSTAIHTASLAPPSPSRVAARPSLTGLATRPPKTLGDIVDDLPLPSKSATLAALWPEPWREAGGSVSPAFEVIRIEALRRSGAVGPLKAVLDRLPTPTDPVLVIVALRAHLLVGNRDAGCALAAEAIRSRATLPASYRRDAVLAAGYCALSGGNSDAGKLTIDLIRGEGLEAPFMLAVLEGVGRSGKAPPPLPPSIGALDYRIGEVSNLVWPSSLVERASPAVLAITTSAPTIDPALKAAAAERAAKLNLLTADALAERYRGVPIPAGDLADPLASRLTGVMRRALLVQAADRAASSAQQARLAAALVDDAGKAGIRAPVTRLLGPIVEQIRPAPDLVWFAESAVEVLVQSGRGRFVDRWVDLNPDLDHWRVFGALASAGPITSSSGLGNLERLARSGRIEPAELHRLVTVLDALDVQMPIPLWEAASRTPQPSGGHLPATGVLAELKKASEKQDGAGVVLSATQAMGPATAADANLLVLGDVIRALSKAGLTREARALGNEALIEFWPRTTAR